jgi:hypothetical protein
MYKQENIMIANQWIETSHKVYATFLSIYPQEHRAEYGESMCQVFTDQCRSAYGQNGALGVILLWLRILPDLGYTALLEHLTSPQSAWGLIEPVPNAPLPWKGVFLILLPGLVYLVSQIAQLTGQPWYLTVYYRAAFLLILPVLAVWAVTRRFPLWGLIPVGLLYRLLQEIGYQLIVLHPEAFSSNPLLNLILTIAKQIQQELLILVVLFTLVSLFLAWRYLRLHRPSRSFWLWLGVYILVAIFQVATNLSMLGGGSWEAYTTNELREMIKNITTGILYESTAFLCLVFIGTLFTRRHGFFAILIPMGYILPTMLVGLPWQIESAANQAFLLILIYLAVLAYRALLSLVTPIWVSRTGSLAGKKRAVLVCITIALGIQAVMQFYPFMLYPEQNQLTAQWVIYVALDEMRLISAILLGVVLYQGALPIIQSLGELPEESAALSVEKA